MHVCINKLINHRKRVTDATPNGGVVKHYVTDAPKTVKSKELRQFYCRFYARHLPSNEHQKNPCTYSLSAEYRNGEVVCTVTVNSGCDPESKREFIKTPEFMTELEALIRECDIAQYNGYYHSVSGLPRFFGSVLDAHFESGEEIHFYNNQSSLLSLSVREALYRIFDADKQ